MLSLYNLNNYDSWPYPEEGNLLLVSFVENTQLTGASRDNIINNHPCIVCYPIFHAGLYQDGHILFYQTQEGVRRGPILRALGDLNFLYQFPAKYTNKLCKGKHIKNVFNPSIQSDRNKLYGFSVAQNSILRKNNQKVFRFYGLSKVCMVIYKYIFVLFNNIFLLFLIGLLC